MSLSAKVTANAVAHLGGRLFTSLLAFAITALLLPRQLSVAEFGIFAFHLALYQLLANVIDFGTGTIVVREVARDREQAGTLLGLLVRLKAAVAAVGAALLIGVALVSEGPGSRFVLLSLAALHLLFHAPGGTVAIFHVDMDFKWAMAASVAGQAGWLLATLILVAAGSVDSVAYLLAFACGPVVTGCLVYLWASRRVAIRFDGGRQALAALWRASWPAGVSLTLASIYYYIDSIMLRPLAGEEAVGLYRAAYSIMTFALMVPVHFSQIVFPVYSRLWARGPAAVRPFHQRTVRLLFGLGITLTVCVPLVRGPILALVYPAEYGAAAASLGLLFVAVVLVFCAYPHVLLLLAAGQQRVMMAISGVAAAFNVLANLWAIPRHGVLGAAGTTVLTEGFVLAATALACWRLTGVRAAPRMLLRPALTAALTGLALWTCLPRLPAEPAWLAVACGVGLGLGGVWATGVLPVDLGGEDGAPLPDGLS